MATAKASSDVCTVVLGRGRVDIARVLIATGMEGGARLVSSVLAD